MPSDDKKKKFPESARDILLSSDWFTRRVESAKYVTKEFQDFGLRIAAELGDMEHRSLYIKMAKDEDRNVIERALMFAKDYYKATNKAKIFMWKFKELKAEFEKGKVKDKEKQLELI